MFFFFSCIISALSRFPILFNKGNPLLVGFHNARCSLAVYMVVFRSEFLKGPTGKSRPSSLVTGGINFRMIWPQMSASPEKSPPFLGLDREPLAACILGWE